MVRGCIDILNHQGVTGWVAGEPNESGDHHFVRVVLDGKELGTVRANLFRPDLRDLGISDGYSGYRFQFSEIPKLFVDHIVELFDRDAGTPIDPCPTILRSMLVSKNDSMLEFDPMLATTYIRSAAFVDGVWHLNVELIGPEKLVLEPRVGNGTIEVCKEDPPLADGFIGPSLRRQTATLQLRGSDSRNL